MRVIVAYIGGCENNSLHEVIILWWKRTHSFTEIRMYTSTFIGFFHVCNLIYWCHLLCWLGCSSRLFNTVFFRELTISIHQAKIRNCIKLFTIILSNVGFISSTKVSYKINKIENCLILKTINGLKPVPLRCKNLMWLYLHTSLLYFPHFEIKCTRRSRRNKQFYQSFNNATLWS